jgi:hypothetical protein
MSLSARPRLNIGHPTRWAVLALFLGLSLGLAQPSWAFLGLLSKIGKVAKAGKAASVGKGGAAAGAAFVGTDTLEGAAAANRLLPDSAQALSKASGLGKAVPDEVAAMLKTPGKSLRDIPDPLVSRWLSASPQTQTMADANGMMIDVERLSSGQKTMGIPSSLNQAATKNTPKNSSGGSAMTMIWYAVELTLRAAHLGHRAAMLHRIDICRDPAQPARLRSSAECQLTIASTEATSN